MDMGREKALDKFCRDALDFNDWLASVGITEEGVSGFPFAKKVIKEHQDIQNGRCMTDLTLRVLKLLSDHEMHEDVWWRCDGKYAPVTFMVNCNDLFYWACADAEIITGENIAAYEQAFIDVKKIDENADAYSSILFCCRQRKMRPQKPYYKHIPKKLWPSFDACGPERDE